MPPFGIRCPAAVIAAVAVAMIPPANGGCRSFHAHQARRTSLPLACDDDRTRLNFLDPCQVGKVPVVLIHGIFDNSKRWGDLIHGLRGCPTFCEHYQIWTFDYDSDQEFFCLASSLRRQLEAAYASCEPTEDGSALRPAVLIGHSLGGLLAKMQVADSEGSQHVSRVIFIATPHCGSRHANFAMCGLSSFVLQAPSDPQNPNTIDVLKPDSPALAAIRQIPLRCDVKLHSIIGLFHPLSLDGPTDGLVAVSSASHPGCESQITVPAQHAHLPRSPRTSAEVLRILEQHIAECEPHCGGGVSPAQCSRDGCTTK